MKWLDDIFGFFSDVTQIPWLYEITCYLTIPHSCKSQWGADALSSSPLFGETIVKIGMRSSSVARLWVLRAVVSDRWRKGSSCVRLQNFWCACVCVTSPCLCATGQNVHLMIWGWRFRIEVAYDIDAIKYGKLWRWGLDRISRGCVPLAGFVYTAVKVCSI